MALFTNHAGFNLTVKKLQLVEVINNKQNFFLENVDETEHEEIIEDELSESQLINILQKSFNTLTFNNKLQSKNASFSLSHNFFRIAQIPYETTLLKRDLADYLNYEFTLLFPNCSPDEYLIRFHEVNKMGLVNNNTVILVAVSKKIIHGIHNFCLQNNLYLKNVDNIHVASNSFILVDTIGIKKEIVCSLLVDDQYFSVILLDEKTPFFFRIKRIKEKSELVNEIFNTLEELNNIDVAISSITKWYVSGDLADDDFMEKIKRKTELSFFRYNPLDKIKVSPHIYENHFFIDKYYCFSAAAGMALRMI